MRLRGTKPASGSVMVVADVMTEKPVSARASDSVRTVMSLLFELDVRHIPILEDDQLVGILSDRDLREVAARLLTERFEEEEGAEHLLAQPVGKLMSADVISVDSETDLAEAVDIMLEQRIGALPVVAPGTQELIGIVSYVDILRAARDAL